MATQHPDNASAPSWLHQARGFVDTKHEIEECFKCFSELGCGEYMWDWEGKHVDEAVVERLLEKQLAFFKRRQLGRDVFLTFRVPNVWVERGYRIARAFAGIISANDFVRELGLHAPPIFECILPLTTNGRQPFLVRKQYAAIAKAFGGAGIAKAFALERVGPKNIQAIPLIEQPENLLQTDKILLDYARACEKSKLELEDGIRVFLARSDPALNNGLAPATLAAKAALCKCTDFEERSGERVHPIIGVGCLPFRGGLSPETTRWFYENHAGVSTFTIQSAFRYDYEQSKVEKAIAFLNAAKKLASASACDYHKIKQLVAVFTKYYRKTIEAVAQEINNAAAFIPQRRERKLHIGLFGYARSVGKKAMPRAIAFTGALYSLGVPPELIGTGRGVEEARKRGLGRALEEYWPLLHNYVVRAGHYLNRENLSMLSGTKKAWASIARDVELLEEYFGEKLEPHEEEHYIHRNLTSNILMLLRKGRDAGEDIVRAAEVRKSIG